MAGDYEKAISIKDAIDQINNRDFLLPAIQRKFIWSSHQICVLFDSIMRGYPINSFMMWEVKDDHIKNSYKFYEFIKSYCQRFNEENPHIETNASFKNFKAVIDGQQRLTSLYIGLNSTYAYKQPRIWWPNTYDAHVLPPRKLYLDLLAPVKTEDDESLMYYNFKFLTDRQYQDSVRVQPQSHHWFCLHKILQMPEVNGGFQVSNKIVMPYVMDNQLQDNTFSAETLGQLYDVIRSQKIIHYFNESSQEIDHVLDVFIRTNSGGTKLDFSDLLMSIAVANWDGDFRLTLDGLIHQIHQSNEMGFYLGRDWVLKTCLTLIDVDVRFKVKNFKADQVAKVQENWEAISECIRQTFILVRRLGINPQSLTSKNAVIPICYYLFNKRVNGEALFRNINNLAKHHEQRAKISQWLYMVLLKGVFGGQADSIISSMRDVLRKHMDEPAFPLDQIVDRYKATNKDLRFDDEYLENLLNVEYGEGRCRALLHLLFPEMNPTEIFHIDHLHPKDAFEKKNLKKHEFLLEDPLLAKFYESSKHWNTISNLHLLNDSQNLSKGKKPLAEWMADPNIHLTAQDILAEEQQLDFTYFKSFFETRRVMLKHRLKSRVYMTSSLVQEPTLNIFDEEVVEDMTA